MRRRLAGAVLALLVVELLVFGISTIPGVRGEEGFEPPLDGWLQGAAYVTIAVLAAIRPLTSPVDRRLWTWIAVALGLRALGFVLFLGFVRELDPPLPYPSVADAAWIAMTVVLLVGLVEYGAGHFARLPLPAVLDAVVGALAIAGLSLALLYETLEGLTAPGIPDDAVATNLAYPLADILLVLVVVGLFASFDWRPPPALVLLGAGVVGFAVIDSIYLYQSTAGTYRPGTLLATFSLLATALIAASAYARDRRDERRDRSLPRLAFPASFSLGCVGLLVAASLIHVPFAAVLLATAGLVVALIRTLVSFRDLRAVATARREARTDELTGAANRRAFNERLTGALRSRPADRPLALLIVDLDDFKDVNDALGHHHGDELIALMAPRLQLGLRQEDLLARIGGDEFGIVLDGANAELAALIADRLGVVIRRPFAVAGRELHVEASIGIALFPGDGETPSELLRNGDLAMYDAKSSGDHYRYFNAERHRSARARLATVDRLREALDRGELELHYQPQVDLRSGEVVGVEALVRWRHPDAGLLGPGEFLPQAESGGLMPRLSLVVLDDALEQLSRWRAEGRDVKLSVNLSVTNLLDLDFPGQVDVLLAAHRVPGSALVLELTEDLLMAEPTRGQRVIRRLLDAGVRIAVDDYGTGYSSLGYLRDLRDVAELKLDRSFVTSLDTDERARAIVASTIGLARALGLQLVAEGVETVEVRDLLAELGCELAQGYLFCRPCPADEVQFGVLTY